ncbi:deleted in malignant brain tumors 1 protein-like, partial [Empidonax traillii]|uniref:deleted in malignant brain tumors 1 protein-like n=1 Tax=Empidonax traillii TaxID=164674 RepID=UPI000FFD966D
MRQGGAGSPSASRLCVRVRTGLSSPSSNAEQCQCRRNSVFPAGSHFQRRSHRHVPPTREGPGSRHLPATPCHPAMACGAGPNPGEPWAVPIVSHGPATTRPCRPHRDTTGPAAMDGVAAVSLRRARTPPVVPGDTVSTSYPSKDTAPCPSQALEEARGRREAEQNDAALPPTAPARDHDPCAVGGPAPPGTSVCRPTVARCVTPEAQPSLIFGHEAGYWRPWPRSWEIPRLIKAALVLPPPLLRHCRYLRRLHWGCGTVGWGLSGRWGCSCACGSVGVSAGVVGAGTHRCRTRLSILRAAGSGQLRLVGGGGRCAGRVEVNHSGEWGSVCVFEFDWEARWATVVCRQLGCGRVASASPYAPFGQGTGRIWLQPFFCRGTEEVLEQCPHFEWGQHFCGHERDVGVICAEAVELRLVAGGGPCAGRVEVKLRGRWGSVGDDIWDMEDAEVVCQQLGCGSAIGAYAARDRFGAGAGPINLALVDCNGDEATLWDCEIRGWGPYNGTHDFDTAVVCQGFSRLVGGDGACAGRLEVRQRQAWVGVCAEHVDMKVAQVVCRELGCGAVLAMPGSGQFGAGTGPLWEGGFNCTGTEPLLSACARQVPHSQSCAGHATIICSPYTGFRLGNSSSGCAGRVEVAVRGTWGSVCATDWDLPDADVLCLHLGCGHAVTVLPGGSFGSGDGPLRPDAFGCSGSERHPGECPVAVLGKPPCTPGNAAAVNCSGIVNSLQLVEGESRCDGWMELATSPGVWHRVPGEVLSERNFSVVCGKLGCGGLDKSDAVVGTNSLWTVSDSEQKIMERPLGRPTSLMGQPSSVQVGVPSRAGVLVPRAAPQPSPSVPTGSRRVRLAGSAGRCAGRVEVYASGTWSTICQERWGLQAAAVVCRELGCGAALEAPGSARFGPGTGTLWPYVLDCAGTEESLWECPRSERRECERGAGAGAVCSEQLSLRLAGGRGRCSGYLELLHNGTWGRVCANGTSPGTAAAVCRQLGCGDGGQLAPGP